MTPRSTPSTCGRGADFRLKICKVAGYWNYDKSSFANPSTLGGFDDEQLEEVWKQCHSLKAFNAQDQFKTYEQLEKRLNEVLKTSRSVGNVLDEEVADEEETVTAAPTRGFGSRVESMKEESDDVDLSYFERLATED